MPITRVTSEADFDSDVSLDVFHIQEAIEVYDGSLALVIDHLLNHIKVLVSQAYVPGSSDLLQALASHPVLKQMANESGLNASLRNGRSADRILLGECHRLLDSVLEIARLAAWPETAQQARAELNLVQQDVAFLDYRYDNDPYPSDRDHEESSKE